MFRENRYDVLVAGARCAGAATAMLMARRGLRVLVVDRGTYGTDTMSTHALMRGAVLQLHRWGLLPRIAATTPAVRMTEFHYGDQAVRLALRPGPGGDALYAPRRRLLDRILVDAAWDAGAELHHGVQLVDLLRDRDGRVTGAVVLDEAGRRHEVRAGLVVGADGLGSAVARLTDAPLTSAGSHATATVYAHCRGIPGDGYAWHYRDGVSAGAIPTNDGQHCVFAALPPARFRALLPAGAGAILRHIVAEAAPALGAALAMAEPEAPPVAFAGRRGFLRPACGPGWALVGDAGYFKDPLTAHGITDALRDAELLAEAAARGTPAAFAEYAATRDRLSRPLLAVTDAVASFAWTLEELQQHHKALNEAMKAEVAHLAALDITEEEQAA